MRIFLESSFTQSELDQLMALIQKFDASDPDRRIVLIMADEAQDTGQAQELLRQWGFPYQKVIGEFNA